MKNLTAKRWKSVLRWIALPFAMVIIPAAIFFIAISTPTKYVPHFLHIHLAAFIHGASFTAIAVTCAPSHKRTVKIAARIILLAWNIVAVCLRDLDVSTIIACIANIIGGMCFPVSDESDDPPENVKPKEPPSLFDVVDIDEPRKNEWEQGELFGDELFSNDKNKDAAEK